MTTYEIDRLALREVDKAYRYFGRYGMRPAADFLAAFETTLRRIRTSPKLGTISRDDYRLMKLNNYKYVVIYEMVSDTHIFIVAVAHTSRKPGYWIRRAKKRRSG